LRSNGDFEVTNQAFKTGGGSWAYSSDLRSETNIQPLDSGLNRPLLLHSVGFEYREPGRACNPAGKQIGFIAQEVAEVFPEWVGADEDVHNTVGTEGFEALTVEALPEFRTGRVLGDSQQGRRIEALSQETTLLADKVQPFDEQDRLAAVELQALQEENLVLRSRLDEVERRCAQQMADLRQHQPEEMVALRAELSMLQKRPAPQLAQEVQ
jgi:hypothetical protein